jgi:hypothetical protein
MATAPFVAGDALAPMGNGRFAMAFVGAIMGLSFFICTFLFRSRNRVRRELLAGRGLLVKWSYSDAEWRAFAGAEFRAQSGSKHKLLWFTAIFMVVVTIFYVVRDPKSGFIVGAVLLGCWVLAWIAARATLRSSAVAQSDLSPEVRIGCDGLLIGDEMHVWRGWGNSFSKCELRDGPPRQLAICYLVPSGNAMVLRPQVVRVPVPAGREAEATEVIRQLQT